MDITDPKELQFHVSHLRSQVSDIVEVNFDKWMSDPDNGYRESVLYLRNPKIYFYKSRVSREVEFLYKIRIEKFGFRFTFTLGSIHNPEAEKFLKSHNLEISNKYRPISEDVCLRQVKQIEEYFDTLEKIPHWKEKVNQKVFEITGIKTIFRSRKMDTDTEELKFDLMPDEVPYKASEPVAEVPSEKQPIEIMTEEQIGECTDLNYLYKLFWLGLSAKKRLEEIIQIK